MLTVEQKAIISQTVPVLEQYGTQITKVFYETMFNAHPELLNVFNKTNQSQGRQQTALAMTVLAAAKHIDNLAALLPQVEQIGHKHRALQILPEHYPIVGENLLKAIKIVLGDAATPAIIDAWAVAYQQIADIFIGVAAVADFRPAAAAEHKIKKGAQTLTLELVANPDILAEVAARPDAPFCVGFAAESRNLAEYAEGKRQAKKLPLVVGNLVQDGLGGDTNSVTLFDAAGAHAVLPGDKLEIARAIVRHIAEMLNAHH